MRILASIAVCTATALAVISASADERSVVVVLGEPADPITLRLEAELRAAGFEVQIRSIADDAGPSEMRDEARRAGAIASIRVRPSKTGVEIWVFDRVTGKAVLREVALPAGGDPELVTTRAVELLRASLLEVDEPHPPRGDVPAPTHVVAWAEPSVAQARVRALVGVGAHGSFAGWGFTPVLAASLQWWPLPRLGFGTLALVPFGTTTVRDIEGSTQLSATTVAVDVRTSFEVGPLAIRLGLGAAVTRLSASGDAAGGFRATEDALSSGSGVAAFDVRFPLARRLAIVSGLWGGVSLREVPLRFGGREVARWGRPWSAAAISLELAWP